MVGDDASTRTVYVVVVALVVIGVVLVGLAIWLWRSTRPDPELLAPLELMDRRTWLRRNTQERRRLLDEVRPEDATPLERAPSRPTVDADFAAPRPVRDFDDLAADDPLVVDTALRAGDDADTTTVEEGELAPPEPGTMVIDDDSEAVAKHDGGSDVDEEADDEADVDGDSDDGDDSDVDGDSDDGVMTESDDDPPPPTPPSRRSARISSRPTTTDGDRRPPSRPEDDTDEIELDPDFPVVPGEGLLRRSRRIAPWPDRGLSHG